MRIIVDDFIVNKWVVKLYVHTIKTRVYARVLEMFIFFFQL